MLIVAFRFLAYLALFSRTVRKDQVLTYSELILSLKCFYLRSTHLPNCPMSVQSGGRCRQVFKTSFIQDHWSLQFYVTMRPPIPARELLEFKNRGHCLGQETVGRCLPTYLPKFLYSVHEGRHEVGTYLLTYIRIRTQQVPCSYLFYCASRLYLPA